MNFCESTTRTISFRTSSRTWRCCACRSSSGTLRAITVNGLLLLLITVEGNAASLGDAADRAGLRPSCVVRRRHALARLRVARVTHGTGRAIVAVGELQRDATGTSPPAQPGGVAVDERVVGNVACDHRSRADERVL